MNCLKIKFFIFQISFFVLFSACKSQQKSNLNLSFEKLDKTHNPKKWIRSFGPQNDHYKVKLDSIIVEDGKYSLRISKDKQIKSNTFGACAYKIPAKFKGNKIKLTGYIKTEDVEGAASLWLRIDGSQNALAFDNMRSRGIKGTTEWKQYVIELPYDFPDAQKIVFGGLLSGSGKMWIDHLQLTIDGKPIEKAPLRKVMPQRKLHRPDSVSNITSIKLNPYKVRLLTNVGMIWGFLKYYHPSVISGKYNWDDELFKELPKVLQTPDSNAAYSEIENWISQLGTVAPCKDCSTLSAEKVKRQPEYGYLFDDNRLPTSLRDKLSYIRDNYHVPKNYYYVDLKHSINPTFNHEYSYPTIQYPDAGLRLLSLYRYWNIIQYFYPSRYLIDGWNEVLEQYIPKFIHAKNAKEYTLACLEIIGQIHDTHANIWSNNTVLDTIKGSLMTPFQAKFIENKLVITDYYKDTMNLRGKIHVGDIILKINNTPVETLVKKYLPWTPASNYATKLRDLPGLNGFLLRSNQTTSTFLIKRKAQEIKVSIINIPLNLIHQTIGDASTKLTKGYKILSGNIGYIYPAKLKDNDIKDIKGKFTNIKGIIIDLRCYPSSFMPYTYGAWLKNRPTPFANFTKPTTVRPGAIVLSNTVANGQRKGRHYTGEIVIIVNATTQSQAEFTTMALQTCPNATVIGSTTAGADGNVSKIVLPGNVATYISGLGVYYPSGDKTQRVGIKIDVPISPTIKGIKAGKDELLEKAIQMIQLKEDNATSNSAQDNKQ